MNLLNFLLKRVNLCGGQTLASRNERESMFVQHRGQRTIAIALRTSDEKRKKIMAKKKKKTTRRAAPKKKRKGGGGGLTTMMYGLSPELQDIVGAKRLTRPQVVKKLWVYIKAHKCQDTKNRRMICPDKKLSAVLGSRPIDMLKMAGCLSKHIKK